MENVHFPFWWRRRLHTRRMRSPLGVVGSYPIASPDFFVFPMNSDTARSIFWPSSRFITVTATRSAIVCSRECESIMRIARVFDLPKVSPPAASEQRCQDERPGSRTATIAAAASEPILAGTLDKPIQTDHHPAPQQQPQPQQHVWTQGFEKLLEDPLGLRAFAVSTFFCCCSFVIWNDRSLWRFWPEHALRFARRTQGFLKKEFSHENIYFWAACERFHRLFPTEDTTTASYEAQKIFERHLGPAASEPVNVDSQARQKAEDNLCQPGPELFDQVTTCLFVLFLFRWIFLGLSLKPEFS